jgi:hypothetical protein
MSIELRYAYCNANQRSQGRCGEASACCSAGDRQLILGVDDALLELPAVGRRLARLDARQLGLRSLELLAGALVVDLPHVDGIVDERERLVELDLEEAGPCGEFDDLAAADVDARGTRLQRGDERGVPGEHADLARLAGNDEHVRLVVERRPVGRDERHVERRVIFVGQADYAATVSACRAFSNASSMSPTM